MSDITGDLISQAEEINGVKLVIAEVELAEAEQLRTLGDKLRDQLKPSVIF